MLFRSVEEGPPPPPPEVPEGEFQVVKPRKKPRNKSKGKPSGKPAKQEPSTWELRQILAARGFRSFYNKGRGRQGQVRGRPGARPQARARSQPPSSDGPRPQQGRDSSVPQQGTRPSVMEVAGAAKEPKGVYQQVHKVNQQSNVDKAKITCLLTNRVETVPSCVARGGTTFIKPSRPGGVWRYRHFGSEQWYTYPCRGQQAREAARAQRAQASNVVMPTPAVAMASTTATATTTMAAVTTTAHANLVRTADAPVKSEPTTPASSRPRGAEIYSSDSSPAASPVIGSAISGGAPTSVTTTGPVNAGAGGRATYASALRSLEIGLECPPGTRRESRGVTSTYTRRCPTPPPGRTAAPLSIERAQGLSEAWAQIADGLREEARCLPESQQHRVREVVAGSRSVILIYDPVKDSIDSFLRLIHPVQALGILYHNPRSCDQITRDILRRFVRDCGGLGPVETLSRGELSMLPTAEATGSASAREPTGFSRGTHPSSSHYQYRETVPSYTQGYSYPGVSQGVAHSSPMRPPVPHWEAGRSSAGMSSFVPRDQSFLDSRGQMGYQPAASQPPAVPRSWEGYQHSWDPATNRWYTIPDAAVPNLPPHYAQAQGGQQGGYVYPKIGRAHV